MSLSLKSTSTAAFYRRVEAPNLYQSSGSALTKLMFRSNQNLIHPLLIFRSPLSPPLCNSMSAELFYSANLLLKHTRTHF